MADSITLPTQGTGTSTPVVLTENVAGKHAQIVKIADGTPGNSGTITATSSSLNVNVTNTALSDTVNVTNHALNVIMPNSPTVGQSGVWTVGLSAAQTLATLTSITNPVTVNDGGGFLTIDGSVGQSGTWNIGTVTTLTGITNPVVISDGGAGGSVSIDGTVGQSGTWTVGLSAAQTLATLTSITNVVHVDDNSSTLSIDDGGGSITVDGTVTISDGGAGGSISIDGSVGQSGTWTVGLSAAQTLATLTSITNVVHIDDNSGNISIDDGGNSITVDGTVTISDGGAGGSVSIDGSVGQSGVWTVGLSAAQTLATVTTVGTVTTITNAVTVGDGSNAISVSTSTAGDGVANALNRQRVASFPFCYNGSTWDKIGGNPSGIFIQGAVANAATDTGNPIKVGGVGASGLSTLAAGTHGNRFNMTLDTDGVQLVRNNCPLSDVISERVVVNSAANQAFTKFNASTGKRNYLTTISILNSSTTNTYVHFKDGNGGNSTIFFTAVAPAGGGSIITFPTPLRQPTTNTALNIEWDTAVASGFVSCVGFQSQQ